LHSLSFDPYSGSLGLFDRSVNRLGDTNIDASGNMDFFGPESALSTPSFITFPDSSPAGTCPGWISETETGSSHSRRSSRRISNGIMDKVAKFEAMGSGLDVSRPCTPQNQIGNGM
jgi:regulatory protein SWI5